MGKPLSVQVTRVVEPTGAESPVLADDPCGEFTLRLVGEAAYAPGMPLLLDFQPEKHLCSVGPVACV